MDANLMRTDGDRRARPEILGAAGQHCFNDIRAVLGFQSLDADANDGRCVSPGKRQQGVEVGIEGDDHAVFRFRALKYLSILGRCESDLAGVYGIVTGLPQQFSG